MKDETLRTIHVRPLEGRHILAIVLCLAGAAAALYFFWRDLNLSQRRYHHEVLGTVSRKTNIAQRRFEDRSLWDRLRRASPLYDGDYVRTGELSGAVLDLAGQRLIELDEHTLIQLTGTTAGPVLELTQGAIAARTGDQGLVLKAGGASLQAGAHSGFTAAMGDKGLEAAVSEGSAAFQEGTRSQSLRAGEALPASSQARRAALIRPETGTVFLNTTGRALAVDFAWKRMGLPSGEALRLDIARDRAFTRMAQSRDSLDEGLTVELENGRYYWRLYPAAGPPRQGGVPGRLSLADASPPRLISPAPGETFIFKTARPGLRFLWTSRAEAVSYRIEIAPDPDMEKIVRQISVEDTGADTASIVLSGFSPGVWYWRVRAEYPPDCAGTPEHSAPGSFSVREAEALAAPAQQFPAQGGSLYLEGQKDGLYFSWQEEAEAVSYTFLLSRQEDLSDPLIRRKVQDNYLSYNLKSGDLAPGQYYWGVYQTGSGGEDSAPSLARRVIIAAGPPPARGALTGTAALPVEPSPALQTTAPQSAAQNVPQGADPAAPSRTVPGPLPPLPAPVNLRPARGYALTEEVILRDRQISFAWDAVPGASSYMFILYQNKDGGLREVLRSTQNTPRFVLTDLSVLDEGTFVWRVEGVSAGAGQKSEGAESGFIVDIEQTQASQGRESGVMFGSQ